MAGPFTHVVVCDVALAKKKELPAALRTTLKQHKAFLYLGASSPDLPYFDLLNQDPWADLMHKSRSTTVLRMGLGELRSTLKPSNPAYGPALAWLCGFGAHVITDVTIHPIVNEIVKGASDDHRICEMTQDSFVFRKHKGIEIVGAELSSAIAFCLQSKEFGSVMALWDHAMRRTY